MDASGKFPTNVSGVQVLFDGVPAPLIYAKAGQVIDLPEHRADRPGREFLEWHLDEVFLKAAAT